MTRIKLHPKNVCPKDLAYALREIDRGPGHWSMTPHIVTVPYDEVVEKVPYGKSTPISDWLTAHRVNSLAVAQEWEMEAGVVIFAFESAEDASKFLEEWTE